jgi:signal peptidase I
MFFKKKERENQQGTWFDGAFSLTVAVLVALMIRWAFMEAYVIPSGSMLPSLLIHDHIFVNKLVYGLRVPFGKTWITKFSEPKKGEVIVFKFPEDESIFFIKRVVGTPGDKIFYDQGNLYINDQAVTTQEAVDNTPLDWVKDEHLPGGKANYTHFTEALAGVEHSTLLRKSEIHVGIGPITIPEGHLFVMGDNRDNSNDSRYWGFVPQQNILGRAMFVWLSCEETVPVLSFLCNPMTIRWKRFFHSIK